MPARFLVLALLLVARGSIATAADCSAANKSFLYLIEMCSQEGCMRGRDKIAVTGKKVFVYNAPSAPTGLTFILGQTVDLCRPEYTDGNECYSQDRRLTFKSYGTASLTDGLLKIEIMKTLYVDGRQAPGHISQLYAIKIFGPSCDQCHVVDVNVVTPTLPHKTSRLRSSESCTVLPFVH